MDLAKIKKNLEKIRKETGKDVKIVAVTKTVGLDEIKILKSLGLNAFGESRIQDAEKKILQVPAEWHMIGHLQSNKARKAVNLFSMIQSVDSVELARKISNACEDSGKVMPILLEINIAKEPQKYGFSPEQIETALKEASKLPNIRIEGFMMMAPNIESKKTRPYFREAKRIFEKYKSQYKLTTLSMGMSNDYKIAVEEGGNMVRIGTALFK